MLDSCLAVGANVAETSRPFFTWLLASSKPEQRPGRRIDVEHMPVPVDNDQIFAYDWANRLIKVAVYDSTAGVWLVRGCYRYDALNRRASKLTGPAFGGTTLFAYDGDRVVFEMATTTGVLTNAALTRSYAYNAYIDSPLLMINEQAVDGDPAGTKFYYLQDRRFSAVALANSSGGTIDERYRYQDFGTMKVFAPGSQGPDHWVQPSGTRAGESLKQNFYGFTGRRYDPETAISTLGQLDPTTPGLWHYRNRMYSSQLGRFLQRDPAGYVDGVNLYAYVRNNPIAFADAFGLNRANTGALLGGPNLPAFAQPTNPVINSITPQRRLNNAVPIDSIGNFNQWENLINLPNTPREVVGPGSSVSFFDQVSKPLRFVGDVGNAVLNGVPKLPNALSNVSSDLGNGVKGLFSNQFTLDTKLRGVAGFLFSILSGDSLDDSQHKEFPSIGLNEEILVVATGILNTNEKAQVVRQNAIVAFNIRDANSAAIANNTHFGGVGDVLGQIFPNELGLPTKPQFDTADQLVAAYNAIRASGTQNPTIRFVAHSQGTMIASGAFKIIAGMPNGREILRSIHYYGVGPQKFISNDRGLASAVNFVTERDPVPHIGNIGAGSNNETYNIWVTGPGAQDPDNSWAAHGWDANFRHIFETPGQLNLVDPRARQGDTVGSVTIEEFRQLKP